jgi:uncharacterized protein (DUF433 family)
MKKGVDMEQRHYQYERITFDPDKCFGKACIRGFRFPVSTLLGYLAGGMTVREILKAWPDLEEEDIRQALAYASLETEERFIPLRGAVGS